MIIAGGLTLAVIVGELDLSIGYAASLHGVLVTGSSFRRSCRSPVAIVVVLLLGALIGIVNGLIVTKLRVNSVIATLGVGTIIVGLAFAYSAGAPIAAGVPDELSSDLALGRWLFGIPNPIIVMASGPRRALGSGRAHRDRPGDPGRRRQSRGGAARRHQRRPHQDHRLRHFRRLRGADRHPARLAPRQRHHQRRRLLSPDRFRRRLPRLGDFARRRIPCARDIRRRADHRLRLQRPEHFRRADLLAIRVPGRDSDRRGRALEPRPHAGGKLRENDDDASAANWDLYVMEFARSKNQPWVDLISGMYQEGVMDLPFSFILAQQGERNLLVDTGFMQEERAPASRASSASRPGSRRSGCWPKWTFAADDITDIVITHAHFDHMGSIAEFPTPISISRRASFSPGTRCSRCRKRFAHLTDDRRPRQHPHGARRLVPASA